MNRIQEHKINQAPDVAEKELNEVKKLIMEVVRDDGNAVEIGAVIETSAVHPMIETEAEILIEIRTETDMRAAAVVPLKKIVISLLRALGGIVPEIVPETALETVQLNGQKTINPGDAAIDRAVKVPCPKAIAQTGQDTIDVQIIKSLRKSTRRNHLKSMTAPTRIAATRRKQRRANVKDLDREDGDEIKMLVK